MKLYRPIQETCKQIHIEISLKLNYTHESWTVKKINKRIPI